MHLSLTADNGRNSFSLFLLVVLAPSMKIFLLCFLIIISSQKTLALTLELFPGIVLRTECVTTGLFSLKQQRAVGRLCWREAAAPLN